MAFEHKSGMLAISTKSEWENVKDEKGDMPKCAKASRDSYHQKLMETQYQHKDNAGRLKHIYT